MSDEGIPHSAKAFDPYAFAEWWLENKWAEKNPRELRYYRDWAKRHGPEEE